MLKRWFGSISSGEGLFIFNLNTNKGLAFFENDAAAVVVVVDAVEVDL